MARPVEPEGVAFGPMQKADALAVAALLVEASGGIVDYLVHDLVEGASTVQVTAWQLLRDEGPHTFRNVTTARAGKAPAGAMLCFPAELRGITGAMRAVFPARRLDRLAAFYAATVPDSFFLDALCVAAQHRDRGIGSGLVRRFLEKAADEGYFRASLLVMADNHGAIRFYERHGFSAVRSVPLERHPRIAHDGGAILMGRSV